MKRFSTFFVLAMALAGVSLLSACVEVDIFGFKAGVGTDIAKEPKQEPDQNADKKDKKKTEYPAPVTLFTEKDLKFEKGKYSHTYVHVAKNGMRLPLRVTAEYTSDKPVTFVFKPTNCAHMGYYRCQFPVSKDKVNVIRFDVDFAEIATPTVFEVICDGTFGVQKLKVEEFYDIPHFQFSTYKPSLRRANSPLHKGICKAYEKAGKNPVILFGDSLTANWRGKRFEYMTKNFNVVNAGICGDTIQDLLWRIQDMESLLKANPPSVATFLIGTNNFGMSCQNRDIYAGIGNAVATLRKMCPKTKIIFFAIPPFAMPNQKNKPLPYTENVNAMLRTFIPYNDVYYMDFTPLLIDADTGKIKRELYDSDCLHFSDKGYAEVITPFIAGSIRLITAKKLPADFMLQMNLWEKYLRARLMAATMNHGTEEMLCCEYHLSTLPKFWMDTFATLEKDPNFVPVMPEEYLRQKKEEGLPVSFFGPAAKR